jgi:cytochrome P450
MPIMGNVFEYKRDPILMTIKFQREYGDIVRNQLGPFLAHQIIHPDHVKHVLQDNYRNYVRGRFYAAFKLFMREGLLTLDGQDWLQHRRLAQTPLNRQHVTGFEQDITGSVSAMLQRWETAARAGETLDIVPEMMRLSLSILGKTLFSIDLDQEAEKVAPAVLFWFKAMIQYTGSVHSVLPEWVPTPYNRQLVASRRVMDDLMWKIIAEHRQGLRERQDLVNLLLARDETSGEGFSDIQVRNELITIFLAGHETSGTSLSWTLYHLAKHPQVLRRLEAELEQVLNGRTPTMEDLPNLPYLKMVIEESLRLNPPVWGFPRDAVEEDEIGGYYIPKASSIFIVPYVTHRHPEFWPNPEAFDPERFAPEKSDKRPKFAYFPFGGGPRLCIGKFLAMPQMQLSVAMIAQRYRLHVRPDAQVNYGPYLTTRPIKGVPVTLHRR